MVSKNDFKKTVELQRQIVKTVKKAKQILHNIYINTLTIVCDILVIHI